MADLKLGKQAATEDRRDLMLKNYVTLPKPPRSFGAERGIPKDQWGMLGNDFAGDCVFAGAAHEHMLWTDGEVKFDTDSVLSDYSALTGYERGNPGTDQGTNCRQAMGYRRHFGIRDATGERHRIAAYAAIEPGDWTTVLTALWLFDAVGIGFNVPESLMSGDVPDVWRDQDDENIIGGHYVPLVARRGTLKLVSWGRIYSITKPFFNRYCDEAWVPFSAEMLREGKSQEGFDAQQLMDDLAAL